MERSDPFAVQDLRFLQGTEYAASLLPRSLSGGSVILSCKPSDCLQHNNALRSRLIISMSEFQPKKAELLSEQPPIRGLKRPQKTYRRLNHNGASQPVEKHSEENTS